MTDPPGDLGQQPCPNPLFVIGSPRSGTSVVPWALAQHPRLWTSPESAFLQDLFPSGSLERAFATAEAVGWARALDVDRRTFSAHVGVGINALLTGRSGGRRWIDQTPSNTNIVDELAELFPGASFLHIVRDGRRVVHSMQHFGRSLGAELAEQGRLPAWAGDFRSSVQTWRDFVTMSLAFEDHHPERCLRLRLEDAVADPHRVLSRLLEQLGEAPDSGPAEFFTSQRINSSFGDGKGNAPASAVGAEPDPWASWTAEEQRIFVDEGAAALRDRLGYAPSSSQGPHPTLVAEN